MATIRGQGLIGKVLGSCVLERVLGYGGSSAVFLAQQQNPARKVAVKVFLSRTTQDEAAQQEFYRRFLREAEAASKLDHPNILPVYSYGQQDGLPYIVMPYMQGGTLAEYVQKQGALSLQEALWYISQLAAALDYAHEHGCVHCDVKPANILLDSAGRLRLSDFGIARVSQGSSAAGQTFNRKSEALMGTPDYLSPEQALGRSIDGRSDIYSLAISLFFLLTRRLPFYAETPIALALLHVHAAPPSLAGIRSDVTPAIDAVLHKALAKKPDERYQTAGAFSIAFAQAVEEAEQLALAQKRRATVVVSGTGPLLRGSLSLKPSPPAVMRTQSFLQRVGVVRGICMAFFLLSVLVSGSFALALVISRVSPTSANVSTAVYPVNRSENVDRLTDYEGWPRTSTYFYDAYPGQYHIRNTSPYNISLVLYRAKEFSDFDLRVTMRQVSSPHTKGEGNFFGVVFRASADYEHYYLFEVDPGNGKQFHFLRYDGVKGWHYIASGTVPQLSTKQSEANLLSIEARGNSFAFTLNSKSLGKRFVDPSQKPLTTGRVGLYVEDQGVEVAFSQLYVYPRH